MTLSWQKRCRSAAGSQRAATRSRTNLSLCNQRPRRMLFTLRSTVLISSWVTASPCVADWWHLRLADERAEPVVTPASGSGAVGAGRRRCKLRAIAGGRRSVGHTGTPHRAKIVRTSGRAVLCWTTRTKHGAAGRVAEYVRQRVLPPARAAANAHVAGSPVMGWSGRVPVRPLIEAGSGHRKAARHVSARSTTTRCKQSSETLMQDRICRIDESLLQRTAGPYDRVRIGKSQIEDKLIRLAVEADVGRCFLLSGT